jgi:hypothetical protein
MAWRLVGRTEQLNHLEKAFARDGSGPVIITGEPGCGRTSLLQLTRLLADLRRHLVIEVAAAGPEASEAIARDVAGAYPRRPVLLLDDAHLADRGVLAALRQAHRTAGALVVVTHPTGRFLPRRPDLIEYLRYEPDTTVLRLPPLTEAEVTEVVDGLVGGRVHAATAAALHAVTGGSPGRLHDLLVTGRLAENLAPRDGQWRLVALPDRLVALPEGGQELLVRAAEQAWQDLAIERLTELGTLALAGGADHHIAGPVAMGHLLAGRPDDGLRLLAAVEPGDLVVDRATKAVLLAVGYGAVDEAGALLVDDNDPADPAGSVRNAAIWAWLQAVSGRIDDAATQLRELTVAGDRIAAAFANAARAAAEMAGGRPAAAITALRRAIISAEAGRGELPWLAPHLTAVLVDTLVLAGRLSEATSVSAELHAARDGRDWDVATSLDVLLAGLQLPVSEDAPLG